jgi:acrylyl-CoA reductase (NADPH)
VDNIPFLLRSVNLLGIDSVMQPFENRVSAWDRIASGLPMEKVDAMTSEVGLSDLPKIGADILKGAVKGRVVVRIS